MPSPIPPDRPGRAQAGGGGVPVAEPVTLAVIGAGNRGGDVYAGWCLAHPDQARVVAVADPREARRNLVGDRHQIPPERRFARWEDLLAGPRLADGVIIATPDQLHVEPALRAMELGYDILLEKPIAPTREEVLKVARAAERLQDRGGSVTVAHVLRYTPFFSTLKGLLDAGRIGHVVSIQYTENIGYWHFAHSYVRGNWRREATSSPMILAKSCHDLDMLRWLVGRPWVRLASFGSLLHFRPEHAPPGAPERCIDGCPASESCPFDAVRFYVEALADSTGWPVSVITRDLSREGRLQALREGPYGRCVYRSDNDVVDHQVVSLEFAGGVTAAFTVCAFTEENTRTLKLMGTHGEIRGHLEKGELEVRSFVPQGTRGSGREVLHVPAGAGHAGGDDGLMAAFVGRLRARKEGRVPEEALTSLAESLESHLMAFAAEASRREGRVVEAG
ncbi:MAG: Gfo/Idh/MocA family oxidoreductase [Firmicutes bacterium]|nr:Gfo/Idh/MocA family oxidoreductase [Bacillota bacterium]